MCVCVRVSHPGFHCGLFHNVLQPLLMVPCWFRTSALFFFLFLHHTDTVDYKYNRLMPQTHTWCHIKAAVHLKSHRCRVSLQHQLLGSPHLLLLHLPADGLFGLIRELTAQGQAGIPHHLLNTPADTHTHTLSDTQLKYKHNHNSDKLPQRETLLDKTKITNNFNFWCHSSCFAE